MQSVFAHELGHYALHHIPKSIAIASAGLFLILWILDRAMSFIVRTRGPALGIRALDDPAILPAAFALILIVSFLADPVANTYSRWQEQQADTYELEAMRGLVPNAGVTSAEVGQVMAEIALEVPNPNPFIVFWRYSHPPTGQRMIFAQQYAPWNEGSGGKYIRSTPPGDLK